MAVASCGEQDTVTGKVDRRHRQLLRLKHGASRTPRCRELVPKSDSFSQSRDRLSLMLTTTIRGYLADE
jgi:hypothetical protein